MTILAQLLEKALKIKNQAAPSGNTGTMVGGLFESVVDFLGGQDKKIQTLTSGLIWQPAVNTVEDLPKNYPSPQTGWAALVKNKGTIHAWNSKEWIDTGMEKFPTDVALHGGSEKTLRDLENEINEITDGMKTNAERYDVSVIMDLGEVTADTQHVECVRFFKVSDTKKTGNFIFENDKITQGGSAKNSVINGSVGMALDIYASRGVPVHKVYISDVNRIRFSSGILFKSLSVSSNSDVLEQIEFTGNRAEYIDVSKLTGLKRLYAQQLVKCKLLSAQTLYNLEVLSAYGNAQGNSLEHVRMCGESLTTVDVNDNPNLKHFYISGSFRKLSHLNISKTAILQSLISEQIEAKWPSRVGQQAGVLVVDESQYLAMTAELRQKFTDKNITISIVA